MEFLSDLWLPIVLSAVFVFVVSSVLHMVIPIHKGDYAKLRDEAGVMDALRKHSIAPGNYMFPCAGSMKEMGSPEMLEKFKQGPVALLTVLPSGAPAIGKNLLQWFVFTLVVGVLVAYGADLVLAPGADYLQVMRVSGLLATMAYALGPVPESIWKGVRWSTTFKFIVDGTIYGLVTGGTFGWLWPAPLA